MSKKRVTYIHIFIWLFAIFADLPFTNLNRNTPPQQIITYTIAFLYLMAVFYFFYLVMVPIIINRKKIDLFFALSFLVVLIMPFFGYTLLFLLRALFEGTFHHFYRDYSLKMHMSGYYPVLTAAVFGSFFGVIINWVKTINQKTDLDRQKLAVELNLLKSKLNPHFLFNTLNNIDSLIHQNSEEASAALIRLSEIMRYLTYETASDVIALEREIEYIQNLIELHRIRIKTPEDIRFDVRGDLNVMISPALFVPLIENAFKFATFRTKKPSVDISLSSEGGIVVFEISNYYENRVVVAGNEHSGYGIINLKKRLELTYHGKYQLSIEPGELIYHAKLTINTNAD
jgi:sensor histidine kinase YesM